MADMERTNLKEIVKKIQTQELLLPDFQRGFVWDLEMQRRLAASVLARMPLGSILILEAKADDYGCRILGRKSHVKILKEDQNTEVLLDGQQRLTVLTNIFSNLLYYDYEKKGKLITTYKDVISKDLKVRFFLRIPAIERLTEEEDLFGLMQLKFALNNPNREEENVVENPEETEVIPKFLTEDIRKYIEIKGFDASSKESFVPHAEKPLKIILDSIGEEDYIIPLYLLIDNGITDMHSELAFGQIMEKIVEQVVLYRYTKEYAVLEDEERKKAFIEQHISPIYQDDIWQSGDRDECFREKWMEQGQKEWGDRMHQYLKFCINSMNLHQIVVPESERERAIDIYENLNIGGVTLSTFELVLARASKIKFENDGNLYENMLSFMRKPKTYDEVILTEKMDKRYQKFLENNQDYSATNFLECYDRRKHEFRGRYTDVFLDVLSLLCYVPNYKSEKIETSLLKRDKILALKAEQIHENYLKACIGIDRALFFLQARCGVRKIQEINYYLMIVLLGYLLANDEVYHNRKMIQRLEAWYWSSIFSGRYDKDQTEHVKEDIKYFLEEMENPESDEKFKWLEGRKDRIFKIEDFSDEPTILMETHTAPKTVLRTSICQFYLAQVYKDLLENQELHPFTEEVKELEEHHIIPIGRLDTPYKKMVEARKDKMNFFNSPVNFAYILRKSNKRILNLPYEVYKEYCTKNSIFALNLPADCKTMEKDMAKEFLKERLKNTEEAIRRRIIDML